MNQFLSKIIQHYHNFNSARELMKAATRIKSVGANFKPNQFISLVFDEPFRRFLWIKQVRSEIEGFCETIELLKPRKMLEIGTASGGSLFLIARHSSPDAHLISLDLPEGKFGGGYPEYKIPFYKSFAWSNQKIDLLRGDSHNSQMLNQVLVPGAQRSGRGRALTRVGL